MATLLVAVSVNVYVLPVPAAGVPLKTPVVVSNATPVGRVPVIAKVGAEEARHMVETRPAGIVADVSPLELPGSLDSRKPPVPAAPPPGHLSRLLRSMGLGR